MPDSGQTQSNQSLVITTPITNLPSNTSRSNVIHENLELEGKREFPQPENLNEYYEFKKEPYSLEYFGLDDSIRQLDTYKNWADKIDEFVRGEIESGSLKDTLETYDHVLRDIMGNMEMNQDTNGLEKFRKLYFWVNNIILPSRKIERRKRELLNG